MSGTAVVRQKKTRFDILASEAKRNSHFCALSCDQFSYYRQYNKVVYIILFRSSKLCQ